MLPYSTAISLRFEVGYLKALGEGHVLTTYSISLRAMIPGVDK